MKKICYVIFSMLLFIGCALLKKDDSKVPEAFVAMEKMLKAKPIDFSAIDSHYRQNLESLVSSSNITLHKNIVTTIEQGKHGDKPHVQSQIVSKTLQMVFFNELSTCLDRLRSLKDEKLYKEEITKINLYYRCLSPLLVRRGEWIGKGRELDEECLVELSRLSPYPFKEKNQKGIASLKNILLRAFVLSVYYELEGIEKARGDNPEKCEEKQVEARLFYKTIAHYVRSDSLKNALNSFLSHDYRDMDLERIRSGLGQAFPQIAGKKEHTQQQGK